MRYITIPKGPTYRGFTHTVAVTRLASPQDAVHVQTAHDTVMSHSSRTSRGETAFILHPTVDLLHVLCAGIRGLEVQVLVLCFCELPLRFVM